MTYVPTTATDLEVIQQLQRELAQARADSAKMKAERDELWNAVQRYHGWFMLRVSSPPTNAKDWTRSATIFFEEQSRPFVEGKARAALRECMSERMITHYVKDQCPGGHEDREIIRFSVPLPPVATRSNSRAFWAARKKAKEKYSEDVYHWFHATVQANFTRLYREMLAGWEKADVTYTWKYCGNPPDKGNLGQNVKALQDFLCMAPNTGLQKNDCTYLGIVQDDKHIDPHYELERVKTRKSQEVQIVIERRR